MKLPIEKSKGPWKKGKRQIGANSNLDLVDLESLMKEVYSVAGYAGEEVLAMLLDGEDPKTIKAGDSTIKDIHVIADKLKDKNNYANKINTILNSSFFEQ